MCVVDAAPSGRTTKTLATEEHIIERIIPLRLEIQRYESEIGSYNEEIHSLRRRMEAKQDYVNQLKRRLNNEEQLQLDL